MYAWVFPGQGSQKIGMGGELFHKYSELTEIADEVLGYSIKELCLEDNERLNKTEYTQPALFVVNALAYHEKLNDIGEKPAFLLGHSLGEYNALYAAGVIDFETGLRLVKKRGELMNKAKGGSMAAVLGLTEEKISMIIKENSLKDIYIANYNSAKQIVLSGDKEAVENAKACFEKAGAMAYKILNVSGAFHSPFMVDASREFGNYIKKFKFSKMESPVISNVTGKPYEEDNLTDILVKQIISSVKWAESIQYLLRRDITEIIQVGPGNVLTGMIRTIKRESIQKT